jgi:hypothetical protein
MQSMQPVALEFENVPAAQLLHEGAPEDAWYKPASQSLQLIAPAADWKVPTLHCVQIVALLAE